MPLDPPDPREHFSPVRVTFPVNAPPLRPPPDPPVMPPRVVNFEDENGEDEAGGGSGSSGISGTRSSTGLGNIVHGDPSGSATRLGQHGLQEFPTGWPLLLLPTAQTGWGEHSKSV